MTWKVLKYIDQDRLSLIYLLLETKLCTVELSPGLGTDICNGKVTLWNDGVKSGKVRRFPMLLSGKDVVGKVNDMVVGKQLAERHACVMSQMLPNTSTSHHLSVLHLHTFTSMAPKSLLKTIQSADATLLRLSGNPVFLKMEAELVQLR